MKRQLSEEEQKIMNKSVVAKQKEIAYLKYQIKYYQLMLDEGLEQNYLKTRNDYEKMKRELEAELDLNEKVVKETQRQLREGVDVKDKNELKGGQQ